MSYPQILEDLFENNGAGPKLRPDKMLVATLGKPGIVQPDGTTVVVDADGVLSAAVTPEMIGTKLATERFDVSQQILHVRDEKAANVQGGTFTAGAYRTRDLNTVRTNTIPGASLANNQITLPAGEYIIDASAPAYSVGNNHAALYNVTDSAWITIGSSEYSYATLPTVTTRSIVKAHVQITKPTSYELRHYAAATGPTNGLGVPNPVANSVFSDVIIRRLA